MNSMTGYGQGVAEGADFRAVITLRGVNHRFLDLSTRLPEEARGSEIAVQRALSVQLARGRVELVAEISALREVEPEVEVSTAAAAALARTASELVAAGLATGELSVSDLMRIPDVIRTGAPVPVWGPEGETVLLQAVSAALEQFLASRREEGRRLEVVILQKIKAFAEFVTQLEELRPEVQVSLSQGLRDRVTELLADGEIRTERLEQEVALLIDRSNVSEELERLVVHLGHIREVLGEEGAIGKRLDFLVQELFRELNTLSAKCRSSEMTRISVDAKVLCEELREQLRNVE